MPTTEPADWKPDYTVTPRRVVCAAMWKDGRLITGPRHYDRAMRKQMEAAEGLLWWRGCEQGFVDQFGIFMTREQAWEVAMEQGQIHRETGAPPGKLYSENLY